MDLNTIETIIPVRDRDALRRAHDGDPATSVLAGGTWLFSLPQPHLRTLVDLTTLDWEPFAVTEAGLRLAATCPIGALESIPVPPDWTARVLFRQCTRALLASYKVRSVATVGGNVCAALPAGAMTSLTAALDGVAELWAGDGGVRRVPVAEFVTGDNRTALEPGEVLRAIDLPATALRATTAFRRVALARLGRSASLVVGRRELDGRFTLTVTASTPHPLVFSHPSVPDPRTLVAEVQERVEAGPGWFDDVHGAPDWRRATTLRFAAEIVEELS
ncbi:FAD binding domain-containing protein [Kineococcus sp. GCM10028916]|uniref:FAD binding domain-containing protein n=1 Tax=Kineococcus sp. GCM10028916 TaxID=3273394 RepID=UPI00363D05D5